MLLTNVGVSFFSVSTEIGTHQNPKVTWQNRLKNPLKAIANLAKTVFEKKLIRNKNNERDFAKLSCYTILGFFHKKGSKNI